MCQTRLGFGLPLGDGHHQSIGIYHSWNAWPWARKNQSYLKSLSCLCIPWYPMIHVPYIRDSCGWLPGLVNIQKTSIEHCHWNSEFSIVFPLNMVDLSSSQTLSLPESRGHFHLGAESWHRSKQTDPGPSDCGPLDFDGLLIDFWSI
jgi:hypothetical protein